MLKAFTVIQNHVFQALQNKLMLPVIELAELPMGLGHSQGRDEDRVVDFNQRQFQKMFLEQFRSLLLVSRQQALTGNRKLNPIYRAIAEFAINLGSCLVTSM